jgi:ATP-binding cassette, subfamily B, bacterial
MSPLRRLMRYGAAHRRTTWLAATASVLNKIFDLAPPALIGAAVDVVVRREDSSLAHLGVVDPKHQLVLLTAITVLVWGLESAFEYAYARLWRNLAQAVQHELRLDAWRNVQRLGPEWFEERGTGGLVAILNDDVNQLERFLDTGATELLHVATTVVVVGLVFFVASPTVAALAFLPIPVILWGSFTFQRRIGPRYAAVRTQAGALASLLADDLAGMDTVRAFAAEAHETHRLDRLSRSYQAANQEAIRLSAAFTPLIRMAIVVAFGSSLLLGGWLALEGSMAVGTYSLLVFLTQRLLWPLTRLGATVDLYQRGMASAARVLDLLDAPVTLQSGTTRLLAVAGDIHLEGVDFAYAGRAPLFVGLDLELPAGRTLAIVGPTGAGKTSLLRMLLRVHDPTAGVVRLDGTDVRELDLGDLRRAIGLVSQPVFLFPGTVRENVSYGDPDAGPERVEAALRAAEAWEFVAALPQAWDTRIGEGGRKLSGGQLQRLAIARALLKDPALLLLDEATSAVDNETEAAIQRSLMRISGPGARASGGDRTTVIVAHRLSTIRHADHIVVLDGGRIVEQGNHDHLRAAGGLYSRLWAVQTGDAVGRLGHDRPGAHLDP